MGLDYEKNAEHYSDSTAGAALRNIESEERYKRLYSVIKYIISVSGFKLHGQIHLIDRRTGREYK